MTLASLTVFDWVLVALLVYSTVRAFLRGFLREIFSLVGLVAGILLASWNYNTLAQSLVRWITPITTAQIVAFILIAAGVMIACSLAGKLLRTSADAIGLGFFDRLLGAAFGFVRGCLLGVACMMVLAAFGPWSNLTKNSQLSPYFLAGAHGVSFVVPHDLEQQIANGAAQLKHTAPGWIKQPQ
ncbi:CvpA family protein [Granulicella arctica]|uniref:CvpA family protein n=1 Tax=Granulicella arctica TaxID=940613 RepID=UPI0021DF4D47|nr:CvpA family protein [Granulicella arctica]